MPDVTHRGDGGWEWREKAEEIQTRASGCWWVWLSRLDVPKW